MGALGHTALRCDDKATGVIGVGVKSLALVVGQRIEAILIFGDLGGVDRGRLAVPHLAGHHHRTALFYMGLAGRGAGGQHEQLIAGVDLHIKVVHGAFAALGYKL